MSDNTIGAKFEDFLSEEGLTFPQLIQQLGASKSQLLNLDEESHARFVELYDQIVEDKDGTSDAGKRKRGQLLEELSSLVFEKSYGQLLKVRQNNRTGTNEIDVLLEWTESARINGLNGAFPCFGDTFLCECKNYDGKVNVTYVGKFFSLLTVTNTNLGIMIAWDGITNRSAWSDALGLVKKFALGKQIYIVPIDKDDLKQIYDKKTNIFTLVHEKYLAIKDDIDYEKYIKPHESEEKMKLV